MAATDTTEQAILGDLDRALDGIQWKGPPSDLSHLNDPAHQEAFKKLGNQEDVTSALIKRYALSLESALRVCSIGCGDGSLDRKILDGLKDKTITYIGLEADDSVCEVTAEKLNDISPTVTTTTMTVDYEEDDLLEQNLDPFDLIWMVSCTYYVDQIGPLLQRAVKLLKPSGVLLVISSSKQSIDQLITKFWSHQRPGCPLHTTESVVEVLTQQTGLSYTVTREPVSFNLTAAFAEDFKSPESCMLLDHLVFTRLSDYPPEVLKLVLAYLRHLSKEDGSTGHTIVTSLSDMITIQLN